MSQALWHDGYEQQLVKSVMGNPINHDNTRHKSLN